MAEHLGLPCIDITQDDLGAWSVGGRSFDHLREAKEWAHSRPPELNLHPDGAYSLRYHACTVHGLKEVEEVLRRSYNRWEAR